MSDDAVPAPVAGVSADDGAEEAVRRYLQWLADPTSIVDTAAIDEAEATARSTTDVIAKLKALSRVEHLRAGDAASVKRAFLDVARGWGEEHQISPASWIRLGVPPEVLREAGITGNRAIGRPASRAASAASTTVRASSVSTREIAAHVATLSEPFVLTDLSEAVGGSPMTVRKAVDQLVAEGIVDRLGPDPSHNGRGRAPIRYLTKR